MALNLLQKELAELRQNPLYRCTVDLVDDDLFHWQATIQGAEGSPYEAGTFKLNIKIPQNYPNAHGALTFKTKIFHPNVVASSGLLCLDWKKVADPGTPYFTVENTLMAVLSVMSTPNPDSAWNDEAATLYKSDRAAYNAKAEEWTKQYAQ